MAIMTMKLASYTTSAALVAGYAAVLLALANAVPTASAQSLSGATFDSCVQLSNDLQMHYTITGDTMDLVMEGRLPDPTVDSWYLSYGGY